MLTIGCHLSVSGGYQAIVRDALSIGANTFAFFTRNPRGGAMKALDEKDMACARALLSEHKFGPLVAHAPYTFNPCSSKPELREYAEASMIEDLERMSYLPGNYYNFHPGAHVGQGSETGIALTAGFLDRVLPHAGTTHVLIETMAGKGTEIGRTFEEIASLIAHVTADTSMLGVCLDTCHVWDGGYDIVTRLDDVLDEFDRIVGLDRLYAIHLNDSMNVLGAHKDRHQKIGQGCIGFEALLRAAEDPRLHALPFILETPNELSGYASEIAMFRSAADKS